MWVTHWRWRTPRAHRRGAEAAESAEKEAPFPFLLTTVLHFCAGLGFYCIHPPAAALPHSSPFRLSAQPTPVLSPGLSSNARVSAPGLRPYQQMLILGWECRAVTRTICAGFSLFCLPQTSCSAFLQASEAPFLSQLITAPEKGLPRVREPFLFHSFLPVSQVLSHFLFLVSSYPVTWRYFLHF